MSKKNTVITLARNLNMLMRASGNMSRADLARRSGVSARMVAYICNAEKTTTIETAQALAEVFGLEGWHLIMPNLPDGINRSKKLSMLLENYSGSSKEGKEMITMIAEREAKYSHE